MGIGKANLTLDPEPYISKSVRGGRVEYQFNLHMGLKLKDKDEALEVKALMAAQDRKPLKRKLRVILKRPRNGDRKAGRKLINALPDNKSKDNET